MKTIKNITSLFLAFVFLLASFGFTINKMICLKSGKTKISLVPIKDCCKKSKSGTPIIKAKCCDINATSFNLGDFHSNKKYSIPSTNECVLVIKHDHSNFKIVDIFYSASLFPDDHPHWYGRQLLFFISALRI